MNEHELKAVVRENYAKFARSGSSCCGTSPACESNSTTTISTDAGYTVEQLASVPDRANLGLGCGNPIALASLREGETVLDLGSGAGLDCFLAANMVGPAGMVIGVDMTPEMIARASENARKTKYRNVEFRLGEIENLPIADESVDVIISNCVINLSPDKGKVFQEAYRVLKPGGRLMVSDIVLLMELPLVVKESVEAYIGCVAGAALKEEYLNAIREAGFRDVRIEQERTPSADLVANDPTLQSTVNQLGISTEDIDRTVESVISLTVHARKPAA